MPTPNSVPSRPTLLTTAALAEPAAVVRPASAVTKDTNPQARDATTPAFYILLGFIMISLILGLFPQ
jgi:hypothetical protein